MCSQYIIFSLPNCIQRVLTGRSERRCCAISAGEDCLPIVCFIKRALRPRGMFRAAEKGASLAAACLLREGAPGLPCTPSRAGQTGPRFHLHVVRGGLSPCSPRNAAGGLSLSPCPCRVDARLPLLPGAGLAALAEARGWGGARWAPGQWAAGGQLLQEPLAPSLLPPSCCLPPAPSARPRSLGVAQAGFCSRSVGPQHRPGLKGGGPASPRCSREAGARCEGRRRPEGGDRAPHLGRGAMMTLR